MLKDKTILLGVTGGIAAYKSAALASMLIKAGADVRVIMTEHAVNFINPITFENLTGHLTRQVTNRLVPVAVYIVMAVSLNLVVGLLGELSLGLSLIHIWAS